jgi:tRNA pseudouridine55 synthase
VSSSRAARDSGLSGIVCVDKPEGLTSRAVVDIVGRAFRTRKVGHAGTLDPLATGVLLVCLGKGTRLVPWLQQGAKSYRGRFLLGRTSDTDDRTGRVVEHPLPEPPSEQTLRDALVPFQGLIPQVPPAFSAVHVDGQRAHAMARAGKEVRLEPKLVRIDRCELSWYRPPEFELEIDCGSGTYVRSIGRDIGAALGCGALMTALTRERVGPFGLDRAVTLAQLEGDDPASCLRPLVHAVTHLSARVCDAAVEPMLRNGRAIPLSLTRDAATEGVDGPPTEFVGHVPLLGPNGDLWAMTEWQPVSRDFQPRVLFLE